MHDGEAIDSPAGTKRLTAVIAGAQRCGTTSLARLLDEHADVCLVKDKEAHWFDNPEVQLRAIDERRWADGFAHHRGERVTLDATPAYLFLPGCVEAMYAHNPDMKVIVVLRDPAERARSQHALETQRGLKLGPYWQALFRERGLRDAQPLGKDSRTRGEALLSRGRYSGQVANLKEWFPNTLFLRFDALINDTEQTLRRITDYLGIEPFPRGVALPWLNRRETVKKSGLLDAIVRRSLRDDMRATEARLGWERGSLSRARR